MADIQITDLTEGTLTGNGVFDKLMKAVTAHINDQFTKGRLKGTDYANVYLGSIQSVIAQSMQYVLQEKSVEADIAFKEKQTNNLENQDLLTLAQIGKTKIDADVASVLGAKEVDIKEQQLAKLTKETTLVSQKVIGRKQ